MSALADRRHTAAHICGLLVACGTAAVAHGQVTNWTGNAGTDVWGTAGNWDNGSPVAGRDARIGNNGTVLLVGNGASGDLSVGYTTSGTMTSRGGTLTLDRLFVGAFTAGGALGSYTLGDGTFVATTTSPIVTIGFAGAGEMIMRRGTVLNVDTLGLGGTSLANTPGQGSLLVGDLTGALADIRAAQNVNVGVNRGSTGRINIRNGQIVTPTMSIGVDPQLLGLGASDGEVNMRNNNSRIYFRNRLDVGQFNGAVGHLNTLQAPATDPVPALASLPFISARNADLVTDVDRTMFVNGSSNARVRGWAVYDSKIRYSSDALGAAVGNRRLALQTDRALISRSDQFNVAAGLTNGNVANPAEANAAAATARRTAVEARMLPNSMYRITWGDNTAGQNIVIRAGNDRADQAGGLQNYFQAGAAATLAVPYNPPVGGIHSTVQNRLRLWAFGQTSAIDSNSPFTGNTLGVGTTRGTNNTGQVRNITAPRPADFDAAANTLYGRTTDIGSDFEVAVGGTREANVVHQDPRIAALHATGLTGQGVVMGQIEPGRPLWTHGAFDNWSAANGSRIQFVNGFAGDNRSLTLLGSGAAPQVSDGAGGQRAAFARETSAHATRVASIMMGFDPMGIQVDGQSRLAQTGHTVGSGFGFVGVAPLATLVSADAGADNPGGAFDAQYDLAAGMANVPGMKVINASFSKRDGVPPAAGANGTSHAEMAIDYWVKQRGVVWVQTPGNNNRNGDNVTGSINTPGGQYNGITVTNFMATGDPTNPTNYDVTGWVKEPGSSFGATADGRAKPDLAAQGTGNLSAYAMETLYQAAGGGVQSVYDPAVSVESNHGLYSTESRFTGSDVAPPNASATTGTSFAAPTVAGVAALMVQRARQVPELTPAQDPRLIKSILQTSTDKPSNWGYGYNTTITGATTTTPLSFISGAGLMNPLKAVGLLNAGRNFHGTAQNVNAEGWAFDTFIADSDGLDSMPITASTNANGHIYKLGDVVAGTAFTATLNWYRNITSDYVAGGVLTGLNYATTALFNFDLSLYRFDSLTNTSTLIRQSISTIDNVEHVFVSSLAAGNYFLLVDTPNLFQPVRDDYALSWSFRQVPSPAGATVLTLLGIFAARRRRGGV